MSISASIAIPPPPLPPLRPPAFLPPPRPIFPAIFPPSLPIRPLPKPRGGTFLTALLPAPAASSADSLIDAERLEDCRFLKTKKNSKQTQNV